MSLGKKTLALFLVLGLAICAGSYLALRLSVLPAFEEFEHRATRDAIARVESILAGDLRALEVLNIEYSAWNDTYEYAIGDMPEYAGENLDPAYWHSIDINMMMIFDGDGKPLYARIGHYEDGRELPLEDELLEDLQPNHPLISHDSADSSLRGLMYARSGLMQVASFPVLTSERNGPIAGALIVGQFLTDERLQELERRATTEVSLHVMGDQSLPLHVVSAFRELASTENETATVKHSDFIYAFRALKDIFGNPVAVLEVRQPREISAIGADTIHTTMLFLGLGSVGFLLAALFLIRKLIVSPVQALTNKIGQIRTTGNLEFDAGDARSDEVGVLASSFEDLTAGLRRTREELESARDEALSMSKAKSEFLARMSHEIRTPMNGVLGMTELLQNTALDEKQRRFARTIYSSAESLLHIINDILDISKIEAGKLELDIAPFNLRHMVEECLELLADSAHRKDLELVGAISADTHTYVEGDALRLRQVLINLLSNAVKFTEHGEIIVRVEEQEVDASHAQYRFRVEDTGIGVSAENAAKIFEPFTQEDGSTTRRYGGTGLGLSICKQLIELMDGEIGVESNDSRGCIFWFTVSLARDSDTGEQLQYELLAGKNVLIVDDNATNREALQHQLEGWNMRVEAASSGPEALGLLGTNARNDRPFDAVLLDMNMPEMDGIQLAGAIRESESLGSIPLLMLSSVSAIDARDDRDVSDIDAWLTKPVRQARLFDALSSHLSRPRRPTKVADDPAPKELAAGAAATNDNASGDLRVLMAEDNPVNQIVALGMLDELGHSTTVVSNGREAFELFKEQEFDLVLMDCQMPVLDGFKATQLIRQWESEQGREATPVIAVTANALGGDRERCLAAGMDDYVSKPFTLDSLGSAMAAIMNESGPDATKMLDDSRPQVLIVDDNAINQQVTNAMVEELGYGTCVAENGAEALQAMDARAFDLVLMDCHMPVLNGYDATREIRRREEESKAGKRTPVIAVTADLMQSNRHRCRSVGMDDYVTKPFTEQQLRAVLQRWLADGDEPETEVVIDSDGFSALSETMTLASIDRHALEEILQLDSSPDKAMVREIVVSYCALSTKLMLQLRSAVADGDAEQIELLAHSLKGSSGQVGAVLLTALCEQILAGVHNNDLGNAASLCERAAVEHSAVITALDKEMQRFAA